MCAGDNHGSAERGCDNDECVEEPRHHNRANYGTDHRQNGPGDATNEVIPNPKNDAIKARPGRLPKGR